MVPIYPVGFRNYFSWKKRETPPTIGYAFYLSWEDGLWSLLEAYQIPNGSKILIPEFYCMDVVENMKAHDLVPVWYPVDRNFQTDPKIFASYLQKHSPAVVVIFHAVGITNTLFDVFALWKLSLPKDTLLIEDAVHRVVNPRHIHLLTNRHFIMDSLRKVVPGMGSRMFGNIPKIKKHSLQAIPYQLSVYWWWLVFQFFIHIRLSAFAERAMQAGYEKIGDSFYGATGWSIFRKLADHIDYDFIYKTKEKQVQRYKKLFSGIFAKKIFFPIDFPQEDQKHLRGFPLGIYKDHKEKIIQRIRTKLLLRLELEGSPWTKKYGVIYLPLGPHISYKDQQNIASLLQSLHE